MEEIEYIFEKIQYLAAFDPETFQVVKVGPSHAFAGEKHVISVDDEVALDIIEGKIRLSACYVDMESGSLDLLEKQHVLKIDDVLHRIPEKKWTDKKNPEIFLVYNNKSRVLKFELTSAFGGTKKNQSKTKRKVTWSGDTIMNFYITDYNDPHQLIESISFPVENLIGKPYKIEMIDLTSKFSVYTKRLFKEYVIEIK